MRGLITRLSVTVALVATLFAPVVGAITAGTADAASACSGDREIPIGIDLMARPGRNSHTIRLATPIDAGQWRVVTRSSDEGEWRAGQSQPHEQWRLTFDGGPTVGPTTDLLDGVDRASVTDDLGVVRLGAPVGSITVTHVRPPVRGGTQSVLAVCVGLRRVGGVDPPAPPATVAPPATSTPPTGTTPPTEPARPAAPPTTIPPPPAIALATAVDCRAGELRVEIGNQGGTTAIVDLAVPRSGVVNDLVVPAGEGVLTSVPLDPVLEDSRPEVRVTDTATGGVLATTTVAVDCLADPAPTVATRLDCVAGELVVTVGNEQGSPVELIVIHERVRALAPVVVVAGENRDLKLELEGPRLALRVVDGAGTDVVRDTIATDCPGQEPARPAADPNDTTGDADGAGSSTGDTASGLDGPGAPVALHTTVEVACDQHRARLTLRRDGPGDERVVVLVDGDPVLVTDLHDDTPITLEVDVTGAGRLGVARPEVDGDPVVHDVSCRGDDGVAAQLASGLVVVAVLASAVAVLPRRHRGLTLDP